MESCSSKQLQNDNPANKAVGHYADDVKRSIFELSLT